MEKLTVLLELTRKCNLLCKHCYNSSSPTSTQQLTLSEVDQLISDIKKLQTNYEVERIILTGGEFIFMDHSKEIFNKFKDNLNCILRIETNGHLFYNNPKLFEEYNADEFYISVDKFHGTLKKDGTSDILDCFIKNTDVKKIVRVTIEKGDEDLRDKFIENYNNYDNLVIECKYVSPTGRAKDNYKKFEGFKFNENSKLFSCLAKNYILFNTTKKWYCCYTACNISFISNLGDEKIVEKFVKVYNSTEMKNIRENGVISLLDEKDKKKFLNKKFYFRCEPCLYLQELKKPKIILVDLPCTDTVQDVYTKGFIFPTFTEKYLKTMLELAGAKVYYFNLNNMDLKHSIDEINKLKLPIYIHLTANKYYSYLLFKKIVKSEILVGGPLPKFAQEKFNDVVIINDELEENGILKYLKIENCNNVWERSDYLPLKINNNFKNESVNNDFSNIVLFSRGCIYNCKFCVHSSFHKKLHVRNIQSIEAELNLYNGKKTKMYIADASVGNLKYYGKILECLKKYQNISFSMNIRADQISEEILSLLKDLNIDKLYIGVENSNNDVLNYYNKGEKIEQITDALNRLKKNNIKYHLSFILSEDLNFEKIKELDKKYCASSYSFHFYIPYPGTYGFNKDLKYFENREWPFNSSKNEKEIKLKEKISNYFNYPMNKYHTITPHNHHETFEIIQQKLNEMENLVNEKYK